MLYVKFLYDNEKMDENGKFRSKGMGFIEFIEYEYVFMVLWVLNNNLNAFFRVRRSIVEFFIEDARVVCKFEFKVK